MVCVIKSRSLVSKIPILNIFLSCSYIYFVKKTFYKFNTIAIKTIYTHMTLPIHLFIEFNLQKYNLSRKNRVNCKIQWENLVYFIRVFTRYTICNLYMYTYTQYIHRLYNLDFFFSSDVSQTRSRWEKMRVKWDYCTRNGAYNIIFYNARFRRIWRVGLLYNEKLFEVIRRIRSMADFCTHEIYI